MNQQTLVAVYDTAATADAVVRDLKSADVPGDAISRHAKTIATSTAGSDLDHPDHEHRQGFWASLFGGESEHDNAAYDRSIQGGSTVVSVRVGEDHAARVSAILEQHGPLDLDQHATTYGSADTATTRTTAPAVAIPATGDDTLELSEERLSVGKRAVSGGTTRIRRYVVETPVEEQVSLDSEKGVAPD